MKLSMPLAILLILAFSHLVSAQEMIENEAPEAPPGKTNWVYKISDVRDCDDNDGGLADLAAGRAELEKLGIEVLSTERNISPAFKNGGRKCGDRGGFVSCFLLHESDKKAAKQAGFISAGLCGKSTHNRVH